MDAVLPVLINGANGSPLVKGKAARMVAHDYDDTHFALRWMHKDASYGLQAAAEYNIAMPTLAAASDVYGAARSLGLDDADFAAVIEAIRK